MATTNPNIIIGQNIKILRDKIGSTWEALAQYLSTSIEQVGFYEIGQRRVPSAQLSKLANLFCMNEYDFTKKMHKTGALI